MHEEGRMSTLLLIGHIEAAMLLRGQQRPLLARFRLQAEITALLGGLCDGVRGCLCGDVRTVKHVCAVQAGVVRRQGLGVSQ